MISNSISAREDLQAGKSFDALEFAVYLDHSENSKGNK